MLTAPSVFLGGLPSGATREGRPSQRSFMQLAGQNQHRASTIMSTRMMHMHKGQSGNRLVSKKNVVRRDRPRWAKECPK